MPLPLGPIDPAYDSDPIQRANCNRTDNAMIILDKRDAGSAVFEASTLSPRTRLSRRSLFVGRTFVYFRSNAYTVGVLDALNDAIYVCAPTCPSEFVARVVLDASAH